MLRDWLDLPHLGVFEFRVNAHGISMTDGTLADDDCI